MTDLMLKYFRQKQQEVQSEKIYDTQCPFCSMQCKMTLIEEKIVRRRNYRTVGKDNPTTQGRLCIKGLNAYQHAVHKDRLLHPLLKVQGRFIQVSWEEALNYIQESFQQIQAENGNDALSVYGGGSLTNEEAYLLGKFARIGLQTKYIDYNGRFCMSSAASAANKVFGIDRGLTNQLGEVPYSECIVLVGTNIAECQPTILPYFEQAKENGSYIIAIDPRETETTKMADLHLKVKPGKDVSVANALLKILSEENMIDEEFIQARTNGFEELQKHLDEQNLQELMEITGLSNSELKQAARQFGQSESAMVFTARGIEQQTDGHLAVRNFLNLLLVTGNIGKPGSGYGAITGQANGQGGREHGQKADQLPGYRSIENKEHRKQIAEVWGVDESEIPGKGLSAYEMMEAIDQGEIKGMLLMGSNPVVSNPHADFVKKAIKKLDCLVAVDMFLSETAQMADVVLPTTSYLEDEGTLTNVEGRVTLREGQRHKPGETKHDWEILCDLAARFEKEQYFTYESTEEIFNELRIASRGGKADYYGITYEKLRREEGILWPCPSEDHLGTPRLFEERFPTEDGKANITAVSNESHERKETPTEEYPLFLTTGRVMAHYLTGVQTRKSSALAARHFESFVEIHPQTAQEHGIKPDSLVKVESERSSIVVRCKTTSHIRKDTIFVPFHWDEEQNVNMLISDQLDPFCRMPGFKVCAARIMPAQGSHISESVTL